MDEIGQEERLAAERKRILEEYRRRAQEVDADLYAPWRPATLFMATTRNRRAALQLKKAGVFPTRRSVCLEIGYGSRGWLGDVVSWGVPESNLHGIELDAARAAIAQELLPRADLRVGDASQLPWDEKSFDLVIASTVFTSILDPAVRGAVASEVQRVLAPGGALLWYDFRVDNPWNPHVRGVRKKELKALFPALQGEIRSVTLLPQLTRRIAPLSWTAATLLETIPVLRTHLLGVLVRPL